jgi:hypothetical protein
VFVLFHKKKSTTECFSISTQSFGYVIGTFRLTAYNTFSQPLNTILSYQDSFVEGQSTTTADEQVNACLRLVYNQSSYFAHNHDGDSINTTQWRIGNNSYTLMNNSIHYYNISMLIKIQCQECILE